MGYISRRIISQIVYPVNAAITTRFCVTLPDTERNERPENQ